MAKRTKNRSDVLIDQAYFSLILDGAICLADSFEFTMYHCTRLKAFRHE